jgi:arylsulfatase A-like enzyme
MNRLLGILASGLAWFIASHEVLAASADSAAVGARSESMPPVRQTPADVILIIVDDWGYADLGLHGIRTDVRTPNLDRLAQKGAWFTHGYVTAPQCSPSRAAILTGKQQQRFGFDSIAEGPLPLSEKTLGDYLTAAGYRTGYVGKWHLSPSGSTVAWNEKNIAGWKQGEDFNPAPELIAPYEPWSRGFEYCVIGEEQTYDSTVGADGKAAPPRVRKVVTSENRILFQTQSALEFLAQAGADPFFLCVSYYAPHVPMEAPERLLAEFPGEMPERRRYALAMMAAVDEGVGQIVKQLEKMNRADNTLVAFVSDNGAPLKRSKPDAPISYRLGAWNGSLNDPLRGEKGMLSEGGIRVPFCLAWPDGFVPRGAISNPVSTLDLVPTILAAANIPRPAGLDGESLLPLLAEGGATSPREFLAWRFWSQSAVRWGKWKLLRWGGGDDMLFDLESDPGESRNLIAANRPVAENMRQMLDSWSRGFVPPGVPPVPPTDSEKRWYDFFFTP